MFRACLVTWLYFLIILMLAALNLHHGFVVGCHDVEREALLKFKQSIKFAQTGFDDAPNPLLSWVGKDCCRWEGVECDPVTSYVDTLFLTQSGIEGQLPCVLANLTSITYLDLSSNSFNGSIPLCIRNMRKLQNLDLSGNKFSKVEGGVIMGILGNLCNLNSFHLSDNLIVGEIGAHHNLSHCLTYDLEYLYLEDNKIGGTLPSWLGDFKRLRNLDVSFNAIEGSIPVSIGNLSYLKIFDLSHNDIGGSIPVSIGNLSFLEELGLSHNNLTGTLPDTFGGMVKLSVLNIESNKISGEIPISIGKLKSLEELRLAMNNLQGVVSESLFANLSSLIWLDLSYNSLEVKLSSNWSPPFQLTHLYLSSCEMKAQFPQWILKQTSLGELELSNNMLSGKLDALFPMEYLSYLNISHNQLTGPVPHFTSSSLWQIDLSYNLLSGPIIHEGPSAKNYDSVGTPVCRLPSLQFLDLQRNNIKGSIPDCWGNSSSLEYINLSSNKLSGVIPVSLGRYANLLFLKLSNNFLLGSIPQTVASCPSLQILDLGENKLSGNIPISWGAENDSGLQILRLRGNQLGGVIPTTLCSLPMLQLIDLAHNSLTGPIPHCFSHLIAMDSPPSGNSISILGSLLDGSTSVVLKGAVLQYTTTLPYVVDLDLSCNALVGFIPDGITNMSGLIGLNLSHNHLTGVIPKMIGQLTSLESLDLSNNKLSGTIPSSISDLNFLVGFNLSNNKLHGEIPTGNQLQTLTDPSSYDGNPGLCGDLLPNKCKTSQSHNQPHQEQGEDDNDDNLMKNPLSYFVIISGLAAGFWGVVGSLLLKDMFKFPLFQLVGYVADYLYMQALVRVNRFRN